MGTAHLLDSVITNESAGWVLVVTTDKVYRNIEVEEGYGEEGDESDLNNDEDVGSSDESTDEF